MMDTSPGAGPSPYVTHAELSAMRRELQADLRDELRQLSRDIRNEFRDLTQRSSTSKQWTITTLIASASFVSSIIGYFHG